MIKASDLIASIRQAYDERWGYIWGTRGQVWTQAQQDKATRDMTRKYGQKWVGKRVADCSGLIKWAYQQHGGDIYHGSNTMFNQCTETGPLAGVVKIRVGTAVFQNNGGTRGHVGIYTGGGMVTEEHGTQAGIIKSPLSTWDEWGILPRSNLSGMLEETFDIVPMDTLAKGAKSELVRWLQRCLAEAGFDPGADDGVFGTKTENAVRGFQKSCGLEVDGKAGRKTITALKALLAEDEPDEGEPTAAEPNSPALSDLAADAEIALENLTAAVRALLACVQQGGEWNV